MFRYRATQRLYVWGWVTVLLDEERRDYLHGHHRPMSLPSPVSRLSPFPRLMGSVCDRLAVNDEIARA